MSVRQYIGARYVPKIFDVGGNTNWVSGISYEPLTVVTYLNNSYTSKKAVPGSVGNPADNAEYWALTGNYNASIDHALNTLVFDIKHTNELVSTLDSTKNELFNDCVINLNPGSTLHVSGTKVFYNCTFQGLNIECDQLMIFNSNIGKITVSDTPSVIKYCTGKYISLVGACDNSEICYNIMANDAADTAACIGVAGSIADNVTIEGNRLTASGTGLGAECINCHGVTNSRILFNTGNTQIDLSGHPSASLNQIRSINNIVDGNIMKEMVVFTSKDTVVMNNTFEKMDVNARSSDGFDLGYCKIINNTFLGGSENYAIGLGTWSNYNPSNFVVYAYNNISDKLRMFSSSYDYSAKNFKIVASNNLCKNLCYPNGASRNFVLEYSDELIHYYNGLPIDLTGYYITYDINGGVGTGYQTGTVTPTRNGTCRGFIEACSVLIQR